MPLKNISGQSYKVTIRTLGSSLVCSKSASMHIVNGSILDVGAAWRSWQRCSCIIFIGRRFSKNGEIKLVGKLVLTTWQLRFKCLLTSLIFSYLLVDRMESVKIIKIIQHSMSSFWDTEQNYHHLAL